MTWWLYDEGGWPSGQALGKVVEGHPELTRRAITRERIAADKPFTVPADALGLVVEQTEPGFLRPGDRWSPAAFNETACLYRIGGGGAVDLLNPEATARFMRLTHEGYATVLSRHFGKTVKFIFTDDPSAGMPRPPNSIPWFPGIQQAYEAQCGRSFLSDLPRFFVEPDQRIPGAVARARVALYDVLTSRFADAYFEPLRNWGRLHGLASGGHLGGEDETFGAVKYGYGHLLRQLRRLDVPGVDLIWRQIFPGREGQSNFPVAAASAAHQNGTRFAFSESFCVYGNGLTPAQMKWLTDWHRQVDASAGTTTAGTICGGGRQGALCESRSWLRWDTSGRPCKFDQDRLSPGSSAVRNTPDYTHSAVWRCARGRAPVEEAAHGGPV
ncbi:MAG: hypothetical protein WCT12_30010 [Verrucomicrobiota bacterium]